MRITIWAKTIKGAFKKLKKELLSDHHSLRSSFSWVGKKYEKRCRVKVTLEKVESVLTLEDFDNGIDTVEEESLFYFLVTQY